MYVLDSERGRQPAVGGRRRGDARWRRGVLCDVVRDEVGFPSLGSEQTRGRALGLGGFGSALRDEASAGASPAKTLGGPEFCDPAIPSSRCVCRRLCKQNPTRVAMLYLVGLGLADERDITVKGLEIVKKAERVYLEAYTAILLVEKDTLVSAPSALPACRKQLIATAVGSFLWPRSHHSRP